MSEDKQNERKCERMSTNKRKESKRLYTHPKKTQNRVYMTRNKRKIRSLIDTNGRLKSREFGKDRVCGGDNNAKRSHNQTEEKTKGRNTGNTRSNSYLGKWKQLLLRGDVIQSIKSHTWMNLLLFFQ